MLGQFVDVFISGWKAVLTGAAVALCLELLIPVERQSPLSYLRGLGNWMIYITFAAAFFAVSQQLLPISSLKPLIHLDLTHTIESSNWAKVAFGYAVAPVLSYFIGDFFYYWLHRAQHAVSFLWRMHAVHHSIEELNGLNNWHHLSEVVLRILLVSLPMQLLVTIDAPQVVIVSTLLSWVGSIEHSNSRLSFGALRYLLAEPRYHRIHHSREERHWHRNFASVFTIWDVLFRTAYFPAKDEYPATGLVDHREPKSIAGFLSAPGVAFDRPSNRSMAPLTETVQND
ncbi:sterol desaturase/sphingolipid hydroxylase (fatty acid hydroxylase superfamily) [Bradyrhizobium sp. USDA 3311]